MKNKTLKILLKEESYAYITANYPSIKNLINASELELLSIPGIGPSTVQKLKAILSLSKDLLKPDENEFIIKQPKDAYEYLKDMALYPAENIIVLCLNTKNKIISKKLISRGTLNSSI